MNRKFKIAGAGCALVDFVYHGIDFNSEASKQVESQQPGDGGLFPGRLIFTEEFEAYTGRRYRDVLHDLTGGKDPDVSSIGGPSIVSLIHAAQVLPRDFFSVQYYGTTGRDSTADRIRTLLRRTPLDIQFFKQDSDKPTPFTHVLSDPHYDQGNGERSFINNIGASWDYGLDDLPEVFFEADMVCLGGTALVPQLHDQLHAVLSQCKQRGAKTLVNTVFDFRNEKAAPGQPWPLGDTSKSLPLVDVLLMNSEEAFKISGASDLNKACRFFQESGVAAFAITNGAHPVKAWSQGTTFQEATLTDLPVSVKIIQKQKQGLLNDGDTTGCGDNFVGGIISSLAQQLQSGVKRPDFKDACIWGIVSGGFACTYAGGTYFEAKAGEKAKFIQQLYSAYQMQLQ